MVTKPRKYYWWSRRNEYDVLKRNANLYDGVMVGAHMVAHEGCAAEFRLEGLGKPYFVDPRTYGLALGQGIESKSEGSLVRRIDKSGKKNALATRLRDGALRPRDFGIGSGASRGSDLTRLLVAGTIAIQEGANQAVAGRAGRPGDDKSGTSLAPEFVVAPYFYARKIASDWFDVNVRLLDEAARQGADVHGVLCLGRGALFEDDAARRIAEAYSKARGLLVWVSGLDDTRAGVGELRRYREVLADLAEAGRPVIALYAGHYAVMVAIRHGMRGVVRGLDMNGYKDAEGRGGMGQRRYYVQQARAHTTKKAAARALEWRPEMRCKCAPCDAALSAARQELGEEEDGLHDAMLRQMDRGGLAEHFMHAQKSEIDHAYKHRHDTKKMALGGMTREYLDRLGGRGVRTVHVPRWGAAMS